MRPLKITAELWVKDGRFAQFLEFETAAFKIMATHGATIVSVQQTHGACDGQPHETHDLEFPDVQAFEAYKSDPALVALAPLRESCIAKTEVVIHEGDDLERDLNMLQFPDHQRPLKPGEEQQVDALLREAFPDPSEANLVHALRKSGDIAGETVLPMGDRIVGYYALSKMVAPKGWLCLAPVAIAPDVQGRNFGLRMMGMLCEWAKLSNQTIVVLGAVPFYERAGFSNARAQNLTSPYPLTHTMLVANHDPTPKATLAYPKPFSQQD